MSDQPAIFHCEGCGSLVFHFGLRTPPAHGFCGICLMLCETMPEDIMEVRRRCEPGGWESEREQRAYNRAMMSDNRIGRNTDEQ